MSCKTQNTDFQGVLHSNLLTLYSFLTKTCMREVYPQAFYIPC